jgi:hypothetical protein
VSAPNVIRTINQEIHLKKVENQIIKKKIKSSRRKIKSSRRKSNHQEENQTIKKKINNSS